MSNLLWLATPKQKGSAMPNPSSQDERRGFRDWLRAEIEQYAARADHARRNVGVPGLGNFDAEYHAIGQKLVDVLAEFDRRQAHAD